MYINFLMERFEQQRTKKFMVWHEKFFDYQWLFQRVNYWKQMIANEEIELSSVVAVYGDFSPNSVALFLALIDHQCIVVPLTESVLHKKDEFLETAQVECLISLNESDEAKIARLENQASHPMLQELKIKKCPGLILFSSGSTGKSKAAVHNITGMLEKYQTPRPSLKTITFLLYDHIGGVNTMLHTLSNTGCIYTLKDRNPGTVLAEIEKHKIELLPTSPTFINMILLSEAYKRYDLSSLKIISYGTEPMPESTLRRLHELFPSIKLLQTYGLSEVGILRSKSKSSDSLWVKVGGEGFETRIVNDMLEIKSRSAMMGYLNAPSPFTEDGWFKTGDVVEQDGEYIKILGRISEIINVGGQKVYPAEVESVIQMIDNIAEVTVYGERNPITGNFVCAKVRLAKEEDKKQVIYRIKNVCKDKLESFKVPVRIKVVQELQHSARFKKTRCGGV
ncbi:acyl-CoA synthetase (AMP-forming)/AMP-acid ligase II [Sporomusaceae bacterium BoRhaA]|uniref:ANL family adenylate-forming protein n=1 Tax=Pelorhabdus rhamnosifermentans TaxID=2772457 RepID=UPI001C05FCEC|nr:fatty acid--CoA ligase family protein [Pelorhabdus rhamnosifermentans]MBU2699189.1 acyl-CoA synthetase (AMP-forming)/AMP-acid ligase II [Pelorhabdus rhamnosifermentans]